MQSLILSNFTLRNVIIVIVVVVDIVWLQYPSREALAIETKSLTVSGRMCGVDDTRTHTHTHTHRFSRTRARTFFFIYLVGN